MAEKFGLLEPHESGNPRQFMKRGLALLMVRRQQADRVGHRLIRRRAHGTATLKADMPLPDQTPRACSPLAPRDGTGCKFIPPQSISWIMQHRIVTFMHESPYYRP